MTLTDFWRAVMCITDAISLSFSHITVQKIDFCILCKLLYFFTKETESKRGAV